MYLRSEKFCVLLWCGLFASVPFFSSILVKIFNFGMTFNCRFIEDITNTVNMSDKLGYVYWFAVLVTITCGGATGVFMTLKNKQEMTIICQQKHEFYETYWSDAAAATPPMFLENDRSSSFSVLTMGNVNWTNGSSVGSLVGIDAKRKNNDGVVGINELVGRVNHFDKMFE